MECVHNFVIGANLWNIGNVSNCVLLIDRAWNLILGNFYGAVGWLMYWYEFQHFYHRYDKILLWFCGLEKSDGSRRVDVKLRRIGDVIHSITRCYTFNHVCYSEDLVTTPT